MATQEDYTAVANALLKLMRAEEQELSPFIRGFIPDDKLPEAAGVAAKVAVDALDEYRSSVKGEGL